MRSMRGTLRGEGPGSAGVTALMVLLVACSTAAPPSPGSTVDGNNPTSQPGQTGPVATADGNSRIDELPSRASLIMQAVNEGRIDPVTGLLYRAYGLFGLDGLPDEFAVGVPRADDGLFHRWSR